MKRERFYYEGKTVWLIKYKWIDDYHFNIGYSELEGSFVGTYEDFLEYWKAEESGQGFTAWDVKKTHCDKSDYEEMLWYLKP